MSELASFSKPVTGTCQEMCPPRERKEREAKGEIDGLEDVTVHERLQAQEARKAGFSFSFLPPLNSRRTSVEKAVKKYRRSAAGTSVNSPDLVRTPECLKKTAYYLMEIILAKRLNIEKLDWSFDCAEKYGYFYDFITNRFKAIRQDFVVQNCVNTEYVECVEIQTRFELFSLSYFQEEKKTRYPFYSKLCLEQINICLSTLSSLYSQLRRRGINSPHEAEFTSIQLLSNLEDPSLNTAIKKIPVDIMSTKYVQLAMKLISLGRRLEFFKFFRALERAPVMFVYSLCKFIPKMNSAALRSMNKAYTKREAIELQYISRILCYPSVKLTEKMCKSCRLEIETTDASVVTTRFGSKVFSNESYTMCRPWEFLPVPWYRNLDSFDIKDLVMNQLITGQ